VSYKYTLADLRAEMARLTGIVMDKSKEYTKREAVLTERHAAKLGPKGDLSSIMKTDVLLADISGAAKTCATLAGALAQVIQAELAYEARFKPAFPPSGGASPRPYYGAGYHAPISHPGRGMSAPTPHGRPTTHDGPVPL